MLFITQKVYFSRLIRVCVGLIMLAAVYLVEVSLLLIGRRGLGHFFRYWPLLLIGWRIVKVLRQRRRKTTIQRQPLLVQHKQLANPLLSMHNYTPLETVPLNLNLCFRTNIYLYPEENPGMLCAGAFGTAWRRRRWWCSICKLPAQWGATVADQAIALL